MKLSEQLAQDHKSGDFGQALEGYAAQARILEREHFAKGFLSALNLACGG